MSDEGGGAILTVFFITGCYFYWLWSKGRADHVSRHSPVLLPWQTLRVPTHLWIPHRRAFNPPEVSEVHDSVLDLNARPDGQAERDQGGL